jgi:iron complex outermembrane recepter protein
MGGYDMTLRSRRSRVLSGLNATAGLAAIVAAQPARAETPADPPELVVTGTRVQRAGYTAPTPTTVVDMAQIQTFAPSNVADYLNQLPQLLGSSSPHSQGIGSSNTTGANILNLRSLGPLRTLVMLDGHRLAPSVITGSIDTNLVPQGLIQRVDIVTGGASASWGSDAVAGVVNFVLDRKFTGLKMELQGGVSQYGDGANVTGSLTWGKTFAEGRGHILVNAEYDNVGAGDAARSRPWYKGYKIVNNPAYTATNGQAPTIVMAGVGSALGMPGGLITSGPLKGTEFVGNGGTPMAANLGYTSGSLAVGGDDLGAVAPLQQAVVNINAFTRAAFDLTDNITAYAEFIYGRSVTHSISVPYLQLGTLTISSQNAYLDPVTLARMQQANVTSFGYGTTNQSIGYSQYTLRKELKQGSLGLEGHFGKGWSWDLSYQHGATNFLQQAANDPIAANYKLAIDAVTSPGGQIVCRSTLTNPGNGCVPLNVFGTGALTAAQRAYLTGVSSQPILFLEDDASAALHGEPFSTWAGPVSIATGAEYRSEHFDATSDAMSQALSFYLGNYQPSHGSYNVKEAFFETVLPLLRDAPLVKAFDFSGAVRLTDYSNSGTVATWKAGGTWDVVAGLRLRGVRSRDIRAPNSAELFRASAYSQSYVVDPTNNSTVSAQTVTQGNTALKPEISNTLSLGAVLTPTWLRGFSASVDYYDIKITDAITTPTATQVLTQCYAGVSVLCGDIIRNSQGTITQVIVQATNVQSELERGVDFEASYRWNLADRFPSLGGALTLRGLASYIATRRVSAFGSVYEYAGTDADATAVPHWRGTATADYANDRFNAALTSRFIGGGVYTKIPPLVAGSIPSIVYFDLNLAYKFGPQRNLQLFFMVQNLLDQDPPVSPPPSATTNLISVGANGFLYDLLGRQFRFGARFKF